MLGLTLTDFVRSIVPRSTSAAPAPRSLYDVVKAHCIGCPAPIELSSRACFVYYSKSLGWQSIGRLLDIGCPFLCCGRLAHIGRQPLMQKSALIVGANRGIGLGLTREYASRRWKVVATMR